MYLHHEDLLIKLVVKNLSELYFNLQLKMIKKLSDDLHSIQLVNPKFPFVYAKFPLCVTQFCFRLKNFDKNPKNHFIWKEIMASQQYKFLSDLSFYFLLYRKFHVMETLREVYQPFTCHKLSLLLLK